MTLTRQHPSTASSRVPLRAARLAAALALTALLGACASGVNLNEVPVEDAKGTSVTAQQTTPPVTPPQTDPNLGSRVVPNVKVDDGALATAGPPGTPKVIYFDYDSFVVKPEFQPVIEAHARYLSADRKRRISVEGHTDERGGREYNLALGQKRSEAVRRALGLLGVGDAQVEAVSFGKEKLADPAGNEAAWAKNRRAEILYK